MDFEEIVYKRRTIRRFKQDPLPLNLLKKLIDFARIAPAATNIQGLEYVIVQDLEFRKKLFPLVKWAALLPVEQRTPEEGRKPTAYIIVLVNTKIKKTFVDFDIGAAVENILLGAISFGIGSCWMASINANKIRKVLEIPEHYDIKHVVSLGYPDEESIMEPYTDSFNYWKDNAGMMNVPKRDLNDIILKIF